MSQVAEVMELEDRLLLYSSPRRWLELDESKSPVQGTNLKMRLWPLSLMAADFPKWVWMREEEGSVA